jgi:GT2 family glycosyltransferase
MTKNIDLSIIILNYNSGEYLQQCLKSISDSELGNYQIETIIVDNCSSDKSVSLSQEIKIPNTKYLILNTNNGFAAGNNQGLKVSNPQSKYVLFLNPDTIVEKNTFKVMLDFFETTTDADAATCYIKLVKTGQMQPECHRGFPTPWRSFCYFTGLYKLSPKSSLLNGYFQGNLDLTKIHPIEACVGAFLMIKRTVGEKINWWNEKYFFYGEDLDFCYQLHQKGFKLYFNPNCQISHFQGISSGLKNQTQEITQANRETKIRVAQASINAMKIFYQENLFKEYSPLTRQIVLFGIKLLEFKRLFKAKYL